MEQIFARQLIERLGLSPHIPDVSDYDFKEECKRVSRFETALDSILSIYAGEYPTITVYRRHSVSVPFEGMQFKWFRVEKRLGYSRTYFAQALTAFRTQYGIRTPQHSLDYIAHEAKPPDTVKHIDRFYEVRNDTLVRGSHFITQLLRENHKEELWYSTVIASNTARQDYAFGIHSKTKAA